MNSIEVNEDIKKSIEEMLEDRKDVLDKETIRILEEDSIPLEEKIIHPVIESLDRLSLVRFYLNSDDIESIKGHEMVAIRKAINEAYTLLETSFDLHSRTH